MATVQSLGLHEPSALPYLIDEGILPSEPPKDSYRWQQYLAPSGGQSESVQEEILVAGSCVVWSRAGSVKRVLNLEIEDEPILHAFPTSFTQKQDVRDNQKDRAGSSSQEKALVVVLRSQAHILLLSGDSHILPLSFEVGSAFPCPDGFILQRRLGNDDATHQDLSLSLHHDLSTINESQTTLRPPSSRPSLLLTQDRNATPNPGNGRRMPRTFSCLETMSELGLIVQGSSSKLQSLEECSALSIDDEILYVSRQDELQSYHLDHEKLCLAVTRNSEGRITIWHVARNAPIPIRHSRNSRKPSRKSEAARRKSSNIYARRDGAPTPAPPVKGNVRESFGGLAHSYENLQSSATEKKSFAPEDIAIQLGPEFSDIGVQTRSARRVSSMLARTDLGAGNDRGAFHDLAMGHANRKSINRAGVRGESIGSFGDRQSFGRRRSSFPATSILSTSTSFLNVPGQSQFDELDHGQRNGLEDLSLDDAGSDLNRDLGFFKLTSFEIAADFDNGPTTPVLEVMVFLGPEKADAGSDYIRDLSICTFDRRARQVAIVNVQVRLSVATEAPKIGTKPQYRLKARSVRRGSNIFEASLLQDQHLRRLLILNKTRQGHPTIHLEAPWSPPFPLELPSSYLLTNPLLLLSRGNTASPGRNREQGIHRMLPAQEVVVSELYSYGIHGEVVLKDADDREHLVALHLAPRDPFVCSVLIMCNLVFGPDYQDAVLVVYWEVFRWLMLRNSVDLSELTVLCVTLFALAVPFVDVQQTKKGTPSKRRRSGPMRSGTSTAIDLSDFDSMDEVHSRLSPVQQSDAWHWLADQVTDVTTSPQLPKSPRAHRSQPAIDMMVEKKDPYILQCVDCARDFVQSPAGEAAIGREGYLPVAVNKDRNVRSTAIAKILVGLHLLYEEQKLTVPDSHASNRRHWPILAAMAQLGLWLGWQQWTMSEEGYYASEASDGRQWFFEDARIQNLDVPEQPFPPPSILGHLAECIVEKPDQSFPTLHLLAEMGVKSKPGSSFDRAVSHLTPRTPILISLMSRPFEKKGPTSVLDQLSASGHDLTILSSIPEGIAIAFHQAVASRSALGTLEHAMEVKAGLRTGRVDASAASASKLNHFPVHGATKDYHAISVSAVEGEPLQRWDASSEADRHAITRLIFHEDRRFQEASKLVNQTRPPVVECTSEPEWSEAELLEAQKELAQFVTRRTLSVASGRGMMHFSARVPLLTERVPIPAFSLQCVLRPRTVTESTQAMTFSADKASFTEDKVCWAFFHNGVSAGLMISKEAKGIDTSWILYNKPPELTNRHAGFLLALGLNGHLKSLAKWVGFKYLTPKHTMTSIGLLLGLSVSYIGTQDQQITRLLSVHVTRLLPPGAAELNLSPHTQTTGIIGIGLIYHNSQHRRMSDVMLSEIENNDAEEGSAEESVLRDEGYRLAAGFSLGLINLGQGKKLHGLHEMGVTERLLSIAVGTKNVNLVHVLDRATAGAVMAIALVFLKTNDSSVARKVDIPDTVHQFDYVRPDIFLLRTLARHLIMWHSIAPTQDFITSSLPPSYRHRGNLNKTKHLSTEDMPFFNILAGICFAIGLRFAGTQSLTARNLLVSYLDQFVRLVRLPATNYDARVTLNSVRNCLDIVALSVATVMAGSGDIIVMRRLRSLHGRTDRDTPFGSHMAAHMALGALFLGGGTMTFGTSDLCVAALVMSFYPTWPGDVLDNKAHLQALRHLWVLAAEGRCLVARDESGAVIGGVEGLVRLRTGEQVEVRAPGLLPEFDTMASIAVKGEGWWDVTLCFTDFAVLEKAKREGAVNVQLRRRAACDKQQDADPLIERLSELEEERRATKGSVPSVNPNVALRSHPNQTAVGRQDEGNPFEWVFGLESFKGYDFAERDLVLNSHAAFGREMLAETVVDYRLCFERGMMPEGRNGKVERDKLWQVRMLLEWSERMGREDSQMDETGEEGPRWRDGRWLKREVVGKLRERVGEMSREAEGEE